jgi:hypothetical protein
MIHYENDYADYHIVYMADVGIGPDYEEISNLWELSGTGKKEQIFLNIYILLLLTPLTPLTP